MTRAPRIAIVGGGIGGLAAALALERRGAEIVICEQSPALNEIGAGLNLAAVGKARHPAATALFDGDAAGSKMEIDRFERAAQHVEQAGAVHR